MLLGQQEYATHNSTKEAEEKEQPVLSRPRALPREAIGMLEQREHKRPQWQTPWDRGRQSE